MAFAGMEWIVVIIAAVLFLFGAKKIPQLARSFGRVSGEFKRGKRMVQMELQRAENDVVLEPVSEPSVNTVPEQDDGPTDSPIKESARGYGISTDGRTDKELRELIRKRVTGE
jgi:sec-independent protein translocase protein TatA